MAHQGVVLFPRIHVLLTGTRFFITTREYYNAMEEECIVIAGATLGCMDIAEAEYEISQKKIKRSV